MELKGATAAPPTQAPTQGGGDATSVSWVDMMGKEDEDRERGWDRPCNGSNKRRQEASRSRAAQDSLPLPFPLRSDEERKQACESLYEAVKGIIVIQSSWIF